MHHEGFTAEASLFRTLIDDARGATYHPSATSDAGNYLATPVGDIFSLSAAHTFVDHGVIIGGDIEIARNMITSPPAWRATRPIR